MAVNVVVNPDKRRKLAEQYCPTIYQEFQSFFDLIGVINIDDIENVIKDFALVTSKPTLYFGVREDKENYYIYYMVYHPFDISDLSIKFLRKEDSHRHDTEGILLRINKASNVTDAVCVSHYLFRCTSNFDFRVIIEPNGHGIRPYSEEEPPKNNFLVYRSFDFVDLHSKTIGDWAAMRTGFKGQASMPDEQYDSILCGSSSGRLHNHKGDIWSRPDVLYKNLEMIGRL